MIDSEQLLSPMLNTGLISIIAFMLIKYLVTVQEEKISYILEKLETQCKEQRQQTELLERIERLLEELLRRRDATK